MRIVRPLTRGLLLAGGLLAATACEDATVPDLLDAGWPGTGSGTGTGTGLPDGSTFNPGSLFDASVRPTGDASTNPGTGTGTSTGSDAGPGTGTGSDAGPGTGGAWPYVRGAAPTAQSVLKDGPYQVDKILDTAGLRNGPDYADATLFFPKDAAPPFCLVAVVPGFVSAQSDIQPWGPFLASYGIATITIGTNLPTDDPPARAKALLDALATVRAENTRDGSPLKGKLDVGCQATMGWSMGGGGTLLAAEQTPSLKATISMAGWNPGYNYGKVTVPALMFAAKGDTLAGGQSQGFYSSIPAATPKLLYEAPGEGQLGGHYMFNTPKNLGGVVGRYGLSWLKTFLEGDTRYRSFLMEKPQGATDFQTNVK